MARRQPGTGRFARRDRGAFTAELAVGLPALMILFFAGLTAVNAVTVRGRCVDAAREGAILAARGDSASDRAAEIAPPGAAIAVTPGEVPAGSVTVSVTAQVEILGSHLPGITVHGVATAAREPGVGP